MTDSTPKNLTIAHRHPEKTPIPGVAVAASASPPTSLPDAPTTFTASPPRHRTLSKDELESCKKQVGVLLEKLSRDEVNVLLISQALQTMLSGLDAKQSAAVARHNLLVAAAYFQNERPGPHFEAFSECVFAPLLNACAGDRPTGVLKFLERLTTGRGPVMARLTMVNNLSTVLRGYVSASSTGSHLFLLAKHAVLPFIHSLSDDEKEALIPLWMPLLLGALNQSGVPGGEMLTQVIYPLFEMLSDQAQATLVAASWPAVDKAFANPELDGALVGEYLLLTHVRCLPEGEDRERLIRHYLAVVTDQFARPDARPVALGRVFWSLRALLSRDSDLVRVLWECLARALSVLKETQTDVVGIISQLIYPLIQKLPDVYKNAASRMALPVLLERSEGLPAGPLTDVTNKRLGEMVDALQAREAIRLFGVAVDASENGFESSLAFLPPEILNDKMTSVLFRIVGRFYEIHQDPAHEADKIYVEQGGITLDHVAYVTKTLPLESQGDDVIPWPLAPLGEINRAGRVTPFGLAVLAAFLAHDYGFIDRDVPELKNRFTGAADNSAHDFLVYFSKLLLIPAYRRFLSEQGLDLRELDEKIRRVIEPEAVRRRISRGAIPAFRPHGGPAAHLLTAALLGWGAAHAGQSDWMPHGGVSMVQANQAAQVRRPFTPSLAPLAPVFRWRHIGMGAPTKWLPPHAAGRHV